MNIQAKENIGKIFDYAVDSAGSGRMSKMVTSPMRRRKKAHRVELVFSSFGGSGVRHIPSIHAPYHPPTTNHTYRSTYTSILPHFRSWFKLTVEQNVKLVASCEFASW